MRLKIFQHQLTNEQLDLGRVKTGALSFGIELDQQTRIPEIKVAGELLIAVKGRKDDLKLELAFQAGWEKAKIDA